MACPGTPGSPRWPSLLKRSAPSPLTSVSSCSAGRPPAYTASPRWADDLAIMGSMTTPGVQALPQYTLKQGPYSSHSLLLRQLPADGAGRCVLDVGCASGYLSDLLTRRGFQVTAIDRCGIAPPPGTEFIEADLDGGLRLLP